MTWYRLESAESTSMLRVENGMVVQVEGPSLWELDKPIDDVKEYAAQRGFKLVKVE